MPPAQKKTEAPRRGFLKVGQLINIEKGGRTLTDLEVLEFDDRFLKLRWNVTFSPQTEIVIVPWNKIEAIGLVGER